ncbi:hypothetical protein Psi02_72570 [Planotetraspora silvatica]|uniref:Uncharacterized protein n=1 Tax=Planotetraspora silvatica TaxID=234614 RepID=A0A8J3URN9_9ACTN|nr:hypothetical protein [Planotetraspora silvatica]GII50833.1 hypothetical protein Psi02_72570 [Planotetraspora silvatica]
MIATFGDFIDGARKHLDIATRHAHADLGHAVSAETFQAGRRLTRALARCAQDFANANEIAAQLRHASDLLGRWQPSPAAGRHPVPLHLSAAATAWGAAGDLLATHLPLLDSGPRSDWVAVLADRQAHDQLLTAIIDHAQTVSAILKRTALAHAVDIQAACHLLDSLQRPDSPVRNSPTTIRGVPLNHTVAPPPQIWQVPRPPTELRAGITTSAEALRALCHRESESGPWEWQRTALACSIITHISARILTHLTHRASDLADLKSDVSKALRRSTDGMEQAHAGWKAVRRAWQGYLAPRPANLSLRQQHLTQMTVGLGRLLYANPLWTPASQDAAPFKTLDAIAPTLADMVPLVQATLHAFEALTVVARRDRRDVTQAIKRSRLLTTEAAGVLTDYKELNRPTVRTSWALSEAALLAADGAERPALWQDINLLELRRHPTTFTRRAALQRVSTREHMEWLATRTAVSETWPAIPTRSTHSGSTSASPSPRGTQLRHGESNTAR